MRLLDRLSRFTHLMVGASLAFRRKPSLTGRGNDLQQHRGAGKDEPNAAHARPTPYAPRWPGILAVGKLRSITCSPDESIR
jgi:hypothetical protein